MEAQRLSLSQIHAAQFELLQEETEALTHSLQLQQQSSRVDPGEEMHHSMTPFSLPVAFVNLDCYIYVNPCFVFFSWAKTPSKY